MFSVIMGDREITRGLSSRPAPDAIGKNNNTDRIAETTVNLKIAVMFYSPSLVRILAQAPELLDDSGAPNPGAAFVVDVSIEPQARTLDEQAVKTSGMTRRMTFCVGCLVTHPLDALRETEDGALTCQALPDQEPAAVELPCVLGQDLPVDCRVCRALSATQEAADALCEP